MKWDHRSYSNQVSLKFNFNFFSFKGAGSCVKATKNGKSSCFTEIGLGRSFLLPLLHLQSTTWNFFSVSPIKTVGGNARGSKCVFPFIYKKKKYYSCIVSPEISRSRDWCATTGNFDVNKKWGYCKGNAIANLGCWKDRGRRAIAPLDGKNGIVRGNYRTRRYAIEKCAVVAMMKNYLAIGVQHGGWCASSPTGHRTYRKYGRANNCRGGKGGAWANDVYKLKRTMYYIFFL